MSSDSNDGPMFIVRRDETRKQIEEGWESAKRGEIVDGDEVFNRIDGGRYGARRSEVSRVV